MDTGTEDGLHPGGTQPAHRLHRRLDDTGAQTPPTCVGDAENPLRTGKGDRRAVSCENGQSRAANVAHGGVGRFSVGTTWGVDHDDASAVNLAQQRPGEVDHCPSPALAQRAGRGHVALIPRRAARLDASGERPFV